MFTIPGMGGGQSSSATSRASAATSFGGDTSVYNINPASAPSVQSNTMLYLAIGAAVIAFLFFRKK